MIKRLLAFVLLAEACSAYPHEHESTISPLLEGYVHPERGPVDLEKGPTDPGRGQVDPLKGPADPEEGAFNPEEVPDDYKRGTFNDSVSPVDALKDIPVQQDRPKSETDLKTDATFWWPFYRSYWGYPTYRSYWGYPYYRYYRPRTYYRYYYW